MFPTILIADDYEDNRELLRLMLMADGYQTREASNGRECVMMAQSDPPDLILIDISMPVLDGWGALSELRADERTRDIPCVALTAFSDSDRTRALDAGFDAYLTKPFRGKDLSETINRMLGEKSRARDSQPGGYGALGSREKAKSDV
ncbi:MAG TPA: response regulator [Pyrinomonadaceae bacterium]|nr:response regulator [Pyrinomonadaceae bacterium]